VKTCANAAINVSDLDEYEADVGEVDYGDNSRLVPWIAAASGAIADLSPITLRHAEVVAVAFAVESAAAPVRRWSAKVKLVAMRVPFFAASSWERAMRTVQRCCGPWQVQLALRLLSLKVKPNGDVTAWCLTRLLQRRHFSLYSRGLVSRPNRL
jgi:hypothetical protein